MLGINLGPREDKGPDDGVEIASVSPGGAAEEAGLKASDVLLEFNGKSLKRDGDTSPREKLLRGDGRRQAGRQGVACATGATARSNTASVVAQAPADRLFTRAVPVPGDARQLGYLPHMASCAPTASSDRPSSCR